MFCFVVLFSWNIQQTFVLNVQNQQTKNENDEINRIILIDFQINRRLITGLTNLSKKVSISIHQIRFYH